MRTLLEKQNEPEFELLVKEHECGDVVMHVFRNGRELTTLTGSRATVDRTVRERFGDIHVRKVNGNGNGNGNGEKSA